MALLAFAPAENNAVLEWLRMLSAVSPRAHLIVSLKVPTGAREMARIDGPAMVRAKPPGFFERAQRFNRRGRHAQAERWYRAALEGARRRGDEPAQVAACREVVQHLLRRDEWDAAGRLTRSVLRRLRDVATRGEAGALLAGILIAQAELGEADALLSSHS